MFGDKFIEQRDTSNILSLNKFLGYSYMNLYLEALRVSLE